MKSNIKDFSFLKKLEFLKTIGGHYADDVQLPYLPNVTKVICSGGWFFESNSLPNLQDIKLENKHGINVNEYPYLKKLDLFIDKIKDVESFKSDSVEILKIRSNESSLGFLQWFPNVTELELNYNLKLSEIESVSKYLKDLSIFYISMSKKIDNFSSLSKLSDLKSIYIEDCDEVESICFIKDLKKLDYFGFYRSSSKDGDLSFLQELNVKELFIQSKRHYNIKIKKYKPNFL